MKATKVTLRLVFFGFMITVLSIAIGIGWLYRNPILLGPYQIANWDRPVYIQFPIVGDSFDNPNHALALDLRENMAFDKVMLLDIDPIDLLTVKPYPLSKNFPDPFSMKLSAMAWGPVETSDILKIGPLGAVDLRYLKNVGLVEDVSPTEIKIVGRKYNQHDVRLNRLLDEYYSPTKLILIKAFFSTPLEDISKIIESQPGHPHYVLNRAQFGFYRFIGSIVKLYTYNEVIWALLGLIAFLVLWFFKLPSPLMYWWVIQAVYGLSWRGISQYHVLTWAWTKNTFWDLVPTPPFAMFHDPCYGTDLSHKVVVILFFAIVPIVSVYMAWIYLTKHLIPKQKRLAEDFFKFDKDKDKKLDLDINDIDFKKVDFDMQKKLEEYKNKNEFFLGVDDAGNDVSVPVALANENFHCIGPIGSGKTATMIMPLAMQALEKGFGACFIDLKGDKALIRAVREKCKEKGKKFKYVSIDDEDNTEDYNPLSSGPIPSKVDRIISALKLDMPGAAAFYTGEQRTAFTAVLGDLEDRKKEINLTNLLNVLKDEDYLVSIGVTPKDVKGLISAIGNIEIYPMINNNGINLKEIMDEQSVVYFNLPPSINSKVAAAIGRMILVDFKYWSAKRNEHMPQFFIFIDEFQILASDSFVEIISQVRKAQYSLILANQSIGNLSVVSPSFQQIIMDCTHVKVVFKQFQDSKFWEKLSGSVRVDEPLMRMESGEMFNEDKTALDGKRIRDGVVSKISKPKYTENTFLKLPKNKSVIFIDGNPRLTNHGYIQSREDYERIIAEPVGYEGGRCYGDPYKYKQNKLKQDEIEHNKDIEKSKELERVKKNLAIMTKEIEKLKKEKEDKEITDQLSKITEFSNEDKAIQSSTAAPVMETLNNSQSKDEKKNGDKKTNETNQSNKKGVRNESNESPMDFTGGMDVLGK